MHYRAWIVILALLLLAGGLTWLQVSHRSLSQALESVVPAEREEAEREGGVEGHDAPEFVSRKPGRMRRTTWSPLDDSGPNHRCNQDNTQQLQNEVPCAASPADPEIVIVGANDYRTGAVQAGFYRTTDAGATWSDALTTLGPPAQGCDYAGDPAICADATGRFYAVYCTYYCNSSQGVYCQTSVNNGTTWTAPAVVGTNNNTGVVYDKPHAVCDFSPGSPYLNNCYAAWLNITTNRIYFSRSVNGGISFSTPVQSAPNDAAWFPTLSTGPNGEVYAVWLKRVSPYQIRFNRSLDGGVTWSTPVTVHGYTGDYWPDNPCGAFRTPHYSVIGCDISQSPYRGYMYVCYDMAAGGTNFNVYFCRSTDGGATWSDPVQVNDDNTTRLQWWPWMTVHPRTGDVAIAWLDRRNDPSNCHYDVYGTTSTDGGATWAANLPVSDQNNNPANSDFLGDYTGTTFSDMGFFTSWPDVRNDDADAYATWWNISDSLRITSPNGGETYAEQQPCSVRWQFRYAPDTMYVELNRSYPAGPWERLDSVRCDSGPYVWTPTGVFTDSVRLRLVGQHHPAVGDTSDACFSVGMPSPSRVTVYRFNNNIRLLWQGTGAPYYHIYSASSPDGPFTTLEGSTSGTVFIDTGTAGQPAKFYVVHASSEP